MNTNHSSTMNNTNNSQRKQSSIPINKQQQKPQQHVVHPRTTVNSSTQLSPPTIKQQHPQPAVKSQPQQKVSNQLPRPSNSQAQTFHSIQHKQPQPVPTRPQQQQQPKPQQQPRRQGVPASGVSNIYRVNAQQASRNGPRASEIKSTFESSQKVVYEVLHEVPETDKALKNTNDAFQVSEYPLTPLFKQDRSNVPADKARASSFTMFETPSCGNPNRSPLHSSTVRSPVRSQSANYEHSAGSQSMLRTGGHLGSFLSESEGSQSGVISERRNHSSVGNSGKLNDSSGSIGTGSGKQNRLQNKSVMMMKSSGLVSGKGIKKTSKRQTSTVGMEDEFEDAVKVHEKLMTSAHSIGRNEGRHSGMRRAMSDVKVEMNGDVKDQKKDKRKSSYQSGSFGGNVNSTGNGNSRKDLRSSRMFVSGKIQSSNPFKDFISRLSGNRHSKV